MLRYLALGLRDFGIHPMVPMRRVDWEFYVVLEGRAGPTFVEGEKARMPTRTMWVFPPENVHGWSGEPHRPCKIAAFQFAYLPEQLCKSTRESGALAIPLTTRQVQRIESLALEMQPHFNEPNSLSELFFQRAMLDLSLIALQSVPSMKLHTYHKLIQDKVANALEWYKAHLPENPSVKAVAQAVHISPSYLRRLFWEVHKQSPKSMLKQLQMQRVTDRLSLSNDSLEVISDATGYASASELCRAFKAHFKIPPTIWRKNLPPPFQTPRAVKGSAAKVRPDKITARKLQKYLKLD